MKTLTSKELTASIRRHATYRKDTGSYIPLDLSYTDLSNVNLEGADLTNANLIGTNLTGVNIRGTQLQLKAHGAVTKDGEIYEGE